eukprot:m.172547 g.172547  ORF g.172547 m.172547 type:complete len:145 (-) comp31692_c0_seq1:256-690(-)
MTASSSPRTREMCWVSVLARLSTRQSNLQNLASSECNRNEPRQRPQQRVRQQQRNMRFWLVNKLQKQTNPVNETTSSSSFISLRSLTHTRALPPLRSLSHPLLSPSHPLFLSPLFWPLSPDAKYKTIYCDHSEYNMQETAFALT